MFIFICSVVFFVLFMLCVFVCVGVRKFVILISVSVYARMMLMMEMYVFVCVCFVRCGVVCVNVLMCVIVGNYCIVVL